MFPQCRGFTQLGERCTRTTYIRRCCVKCHDHCRCGNQSFRRNYTPLAFTSRRRKFTSRINDSLPLYPTSDDEDFIAPEGEPEEEPWTDDDSEDLQAEIVEPPPKRRKVYRVIIESDEE